MISETAFSANYASVWRSLTPTMDEFVRRMNMDGYEREWIPLDAKAPVERRGFINEAGFFLARDAVTNGKSLADPWLASEIEAAIRSSFRFVVGESDDLPDLSEVERLEVENLARRLQRYFFGFRGGEIEFGPVFPGCGILKECNGDVLITESDLYEVKSGDRAFRSVDYRQILIYLALRFAKTRLILDSLVLLNPRTGMIVRSSAENMARQVSGKSAAELCHDIIASFSASLVSE